MCATCGCGDVTDQGQHPDHDHDHHHHHHHHDAVAHVHSRQTARTVQLEQEVLAKNDGLAARNRAWLEARSIGAWNLMSSPGSGKTTLLERTARDLGGDLPMAVIEGDQATVRDAERMRAAGCPVVQINTGRGCHLDAAMVGEALRRLAPPPRSVVVIENVGNLVCPALFDLGEATRAVLMSVTEGDDKPLKYPHMFRASDLMILTKVDLLPYVDFDVARCRDYARRINPRLDVIELSATRGDGLERWYGRLRARAIPASAYPT
jgi:hydrogenase nickel incorporation protein HypB